MSLKDKVAPEEKIKLVEQYMSGTISQHEISRITGLNLSSIQDWICKYKAEGLLLSSQRIKIENIRPNLRRKW